MMPMVLAIALAGVVTVAVLEPGLREAPVERLSTLAAEGIDRMRIEVAGQPAIVLARQADAWRMLEPLDMPANPVRAEALTTLARAPVVRSYDLQQVAPASVGLEPPRVRLHLGTLRLDIGQRHPVDDLRFVRVGDRIHLLLDRFQHHAAASVAGHIDPSLLGHRPRVSALRLSEVQVQRSTEGWRWQPPGALSSADDAVALVQRWEAASALQVQALDTALRWARPVEVTLADGEVLAFMVAIGDDAVVFGRRDVALQYRVPLRRGRALLGPLAQSAAPATAGDQAAQ